MLAKERRLGHEIMVRGGGEGPGMRYQFTEPMLERYCRELFLVTPDELLKRLAPALGRLDERVEAIVDERVAPEVEQLRAEGELVASAVERNSSAIRTLERRVSNLESYQELPGATTREP